MNSQKHPAFQKTIFENGLTLVTEELHGFQSLALGIWVKLGSRHEPLKLAGVSHFIEHMLFKGTHKRSALRIAQEVDQKGGEMNAFTSREHTCLHLLLLKQDYQFGFEILSDILLNSTFKTKELNREREVILQELAMAEESPEELAHDLFFEKVFHSQALGQPILGTQKTLKALKRAELMAFLNYFYRPDQIVVSVAGDLSHSRVLRELKPLRSWRPKPRVKSFITAQNSDTKKPQFCLGKWWIPRPTEQVHLIWGVPALSYGSKDRSAAALLNLSLGGGTSSELFQEIREKKGLAYSVYSSLSLFSDCGVFFVYLATAPEKFAAGLKLVKAAAQRSRSRLMSQRKLKLLKSNLIGTITLSADSVEARMSSIAKNELYIRRNMPIRKICKQIEAVSSADIKRVACELFPPQIFSDDGAYAMLALGPRLPKSISKKLVT